MSNTRPLSEYSRQELYDLIWSTPAIKLATEFEISSVAIAKWCKRRRVPRPPRGYWAKVEAGQKPEKAPLPPTGNEALAQAAQGRIAKTLSLPADTDTLLPLASDLMTAITKSKLDGYKRTRLEDRLFPAVTVSKNLAQRVAQAFHVLLQRLEPMDVRFRKFHGKYETGYFERQRDRLFMAVIEDLVKPDGSRINPPSWQRPHEKVKPSGFLIFSFKTARYGQQDPKEWTETAKLPLDQVLAQVVAGVRKHFMDLQEERQRQQVESEKRHAEWLKERAEWERKEGIRLQEEKRLKHIQTLANTAKARHANLLKAAENWRLSQTLADFIDACEARWKSQSDTPTPEQISWLTWARAIAVETSPFFEGYPDPANDGTFEPESVPLGGPYPQPRKFK